MRAQGKPWSYKLEGQIDKCRASGLPRAEAQEKKQLEPKPCRKTKLWLMNCWRPHTNNYEVKAGKLATEESPWYYDMYIQELDHIHTVNKGEKSLLVSQEGKTFWNIPVFLLSTECNLGLGVLSKCNWAWEGKYPTLAHLDHLVPLKWGKEEKKEPEKQWYSWQSRHIGSLTS